MKLYKKEIDRQIEKAKRKLISIEEEHKLLESIKKGDEKAITLLVDSHEYIILKIVKELNDNSIALPEMVSFIKEALKRLAEKEVKNFEPEEFSKYSYWWIIGAINEFVTKKK